MIHLKINNQDISVPVGTSVLRAAQSLGISIPTMCFLQDDFSNHPSCMVCIVKDKRTNALIPSCAMLTETGMDIITDDEEVVNARKEALELLMSDHVGDCEAPCRIACPAFMNIPEMNRLIAAGKFDEAIKVVKEDIALPFILGFICSAPCEKVCRRKQADNAVSICMLKRFVAEVDSENQTNYLPDKISPSGKKIAVIGAEPAGLACAFYLLRNGHSCTIYEAKSKIGGTLVDLGESELPQNVLNFEVELLKKYGADFKLNTTVSHEIFKNDLLKNYDSVVIASGEFIGSNISDLGFETTKNGLKIDAKTYKTNLNGVFACGSVVSPQKMAIKALAQGKEAAYSIHDFLMDTSTINKSEIFNSKFGLLHPSEVSEYLKESTNEDRVQPHGGFIKGFTVDEAIIEAKRCMHCDCRKADNCKLRIYSEEYNIDRKRYAFGERKVIKKHFQHEFVVYEPEKCIKCGLCIEITAKNKELTGLSYIGRGFDVRIDIPFGLTINEALTQTAKKCVEACPTGALANKK